MPALPDSLDKVRKSAADALRPLLGSACGAADDALFDLSQNGPEDEQSHAFNAMRELRLKRQEVIDAILAGMDQDFLALNMPVEEKKAASTYSLDTLTLLDDDALDISVAFQGMGARSRDALGTELDHLRQRIDRVLAQEVPVERLPLHPERICEHFRLAIEPLQMPIKSRLIMIKHFERQVLGALGEVLGGANEQLSKAGFLPEIKAAKARPSPMRAGASERGGKTDKRSARHDDDDAEEDDDDDGQPRRRRGGDGGDLAAMSGAFAELLALARGAQGGGGGQGGGFAMQPGQPLPDGMVAVPPGGVMPAGMVPVQFTQMPVGQMPVMYGGQMMIGGQPVQSDVPVQVMAPAELASLLTQLQRLQQTPLLGNAGQIEKDAGGYVIEHADLATVDVNSGLSELLRGDEAAAPRALDSSDNDVINLVSMLFDFILDDPDLSADMKALLGRLQIPLLKVSLLDKTFFELDDHPARNLLNALARAGVGWTREADDGLYAKVESIVHRILTDFTDNIGIFGQLEAELTVFVAEREKRMTTIESRLRDREEGQSRAVIAQEQVREVIAARLAGRTLPPVVIAVIQDAWQRVLHHTAIREGVESEAWQQRVKVLEVLVWCAVRHDKEEARTRQRGVVPRLLVSLRRGLEAVGFDSLRADAMLSALRPVLESLGAGEQARTVRVLMERAAPEKPGASKSAPVGVGDAMQVLRSNDDEIVIAAPAEPVVPAPDVVDERWYQTADSLAPGTWIEFHDDENNFTVRGKIAARIRAQNKYIFVNGRGVKIAEKTVPQLAHDLRGGVARLVSDAALFDRALETMISRLKTGAPG